MSDLKDEVFSVSELGLMLRLLDDYKDEMYDILEDNSLTTLERNNAITNQAIALCAIKKLKKMLKSVDVDPESFLYHEDDE